jgi:hypothetical protein
VRHEPCPLKGKVGDAPKAEKDGVI